MTFGFGQSGPRKKLVRPLRESKSERLEVRVVLSVKRVIREAMSVTGLAYEGARRLLDEHRRMALADADNKALFAALERQPRPSARLVEALSIIGVFLADKRHWPGPYAADGAGGATGRCTLPSL
jgi:uncharacterized protein (DUF1778 family)